MESFAIAPRTANEAALADLLQQLKVAFLNNDTLAMSAIMQERQKYEQPARAAGDQFDYDNFNVADMPDPNLVFANAEADVDGDGNYDDVLDYDISELPTPDELFGDFNQTQIPPQPVPKPRARGAGARGYCPAPRPQPQAYFQPMINPLLLQSYPINIAAAQNRVNMKREAMYTDRKREAMYAEVAARKAAKRAAECAYSGAVLADCKNAGHRSKQQCSNAARHLSHC